MKFLSTKDILPKEGARAGRVLYHKSSILSSLKAWKENDINSVIDYAEKAKLWPGNLGSGRPYDVDERMEDFILWKGYAKKKDTSNAEKHRMKLLQYAFNPEDPSDNLMLQFIASDRMKRKDIINSMDSQKQESLIQWMTNIEKNEPSIPLLEEVSVVKQIISTLKSIP
ncbi:MAG: hypothetical protein HKN68_13885 [Saprospiraceae bacterium]|nr:hypothetical protein [Saprospiraceae bacterium]